MSAVQEESSAVEAPVEREGMRWWIVAVVGVLALAIGLMIGRALDDGDAASDVGTPDGGDAAMSEPEQVVDDYNTAWEENDREAILAAVTEDFTEEYRWYTESDGQVSVGGDSWDASSAASYASTSDYQIDLSGEAIVVGDGPWFISVTESQTGGGYTYEGTTSYVVVDDDGTLKLDRKSWVGSRQPLTE